MSTANNPAGRLYDIHRAMTSVGKERHNKPAYEVFREILCPSENRADIVVARIVRVLELPDVIKRKIENIPDIAHGRYFSWMPKLMNVFKSRNFDQGFEIFLGGFDSNTPSLLGFCDEVLSDHAPELVVAQETIDQMRAQLATFDKEVRLAELDERLREYILHYVDLIDRALIDYRIVGIEALKNGLEQIGGVLSTHKSSADQVMVTEFSSKFVAAFLGLAVVCSGYSGAKQLLSDTSRLLPAFAEQAEVELKDVQMLTAAKNTNDPEPAEIDASP